MVQGASRARQHRSNLNKAVRESVLGCFAWTSPANIRKYGEPPYRHSDDDLVPAFDRQDHYFGGEQPSPSFPCPCLMAAVIVACVGIPQVCTASMGCGQCPVLACVEACCHGLLL